MAAVTLSASQPPPFVNANPVELLPLPEALNKMGVVHEKWDVQNIDLTSVDLKHPVEGLVTQILKSNQVLVKRIYDFKTPDGSLDIVHLFPEMPGLDELLRNFDAIHYHESPEIRLILDGEGIFHIYTVTKEKHSIPVEKGSFLVLPAHIKHNFTLTEKRDVTALRIFQDQNGWIAKTD